MSVIADVSHSDPVVVAAAFSPLSELVAKGGEYISAHKITRDTELDGVTEVINRWIDGDLNAMAKLKVSQPGGEFMQECWKALHKVSAGTVVSYGELARRAGRPMASRAAGTACATNLIAPIVPCHRVVRTGGNIGNYGFGVGLKRSLLLHEGVDL